MLLAILVFAVMLALAFIAGLFVWWLTRRGTVRLQILLSSLTAALLSAPTLFGAGHGVGVLPLPVALLPGAHVVFLSVALSLPITWLLWGFGFWLLNASVAALGRHRARRRGVAADE